MRLFVCVVMIDELVSTLRSSSGVLFIWCVCVWGGGGGWVGGRTADLCPQVHLQGLRLGSRVGIWLHVVPTEPVMAGSPLMQVQVRVNVCVCYVCMRLCVQAKTML